MASIQMYNYKPTPKFFGTPHLGVYLGVELELDVVGCSARDNCPVKLATINKVEKLLGDFVYFKRDGSIDGVEIVSHPASLLVHRKRWKKFFDTFHEGKAIGAFFVHAHDGLHVHATRTDLTKHQIWEIHSFVNGQIDERKEGTAAKWLRDLAGRDFNNYAQRIVKPEMEVLSPKAFVSKYEAVNCLPPKTIEFRLFAATLDFEKFMLRLEFAAALVQAAQQLDCSLSFDSFKSFLATHPKRFPILVEWMHAI